MWRIPGVLSCGYKYVGNRVAPTGRGKGGLGLGKTNRTSMLTSASAEIHLRAFADKGWKPRCLAPCQNGLATSMVLGRHYDGTQWTVNFGEYTPVVSPHAYYFHKDKVLDKWVTIRLEEYLRLYNGLTPCRGSLELLAQTLDIAVVLKGGLQDQGTIMVQPMFLQNGSASVLYTGVQDGMKELSCSALCELCEKDPNLNLFYWEAPDAAPSNTRQRKFVSLKFLPMPRVFQMPLPGCVVHGLHRIMLGASRTDNLHGDLHATATVSRHIHNRNLLIHALDKLCDSEEFEWNLDIDPNPEWLEHTLDIFRHTIAMDTRGSLDEEGSVLFYSISFILLLFLVRIIFFYQQSGFRLFSREAWG